MSNIVELTFYGHIENDGTLKIHDLKGFKAYYQQFKGKAISIDLKLKRSSRSAEQNRLWWVYMTILSKELGYTKVEIHEICKFKFLKKEIVDEKTGEVFQLLGSTAKLSKSEFSDLVAELQQWSAETFNVDLPSPGEK